MKKTLYVLLAVAIVLGVSGFFAQDKIAVGATLLFPRGGGTGTSSVNATDVGKYLKITDDSPFTYGFDTPGSSGASFPFTVNSWGNSTTSVLGFTNGFISNASSTQVWSNLGSSTATILAANTLNTGQGAYELYNMNQDVTTTSNVSFGTIGGTDGTLTSLSLDTNGIALDTDGDGALSIQSISAGQQEEIRVNLDDTANSAFWTSSTGVTAWLMDLIGISSNASSSFSWLNSASSTLGTTHITTGAKFADGYTQTRGSFSFGATDVNATTTDIFTMQSFENAVTIRSISGVIDCPNGCVTVPSGITVKFWHGTNRSASTSATALFTVNPTFTSTTTLQTFNTSFNDATLAAGEILWYQIVAASTTQMSIDFTGTATND